MNTVYIVLAGDDYYPSGSKDIKAVFTDKASAEEFAQELRDKVETYPDLKGDPMKFYDWVEVVEHSVVQP